MSFFGFSDLAYEVIDEATKSFIPDYIKDEARKEEFDEVCNIIEDFMESVLAEGFEIDIDDEHKDILVTVESIDIYVDSSENSFYEAIERCKEFSFSRNEAGDLVTTFRFPGVWKRVSS